MDCHLKNILQYSTKRNACLSFIIFLITLILLFPVYAGSSNSNDSIVSAARSLAEALDNQITLSGVKIQVSENNLWERQTLMNLPFSSILRDALALKISENKAIVTVSEVGDEPIILVGNYGFENKNLVITVRLRKMGDETSEDLAVARANIPRSRIDENWFKPDFKRVARTLIRLIEKNYYGTDKLALKIHTLKPGLKGQPSILLGQEFVKYLETAVSSSSLFEMSSLAQERSSASMEGTYSNVNGRMHFNIQVLDVENTRLTSADFDVSVNDIPESLFKEIALDDLTVCLSYKTVNKDDFSAESSEADELLSLVSEALADYGIKSVSCRRNSQGKMRVESNINVKKKQMKGGRFIVTGKIKIDVYDEDGNKLGSLPEKPVKARFISADNDEDISQKIFEKYFVNGNIGNDCAKLILKRKKY